MSFALLALSTLMAFGCIAGFEAALSSIGARTTALDFEIATQSRTVKAAEDIQRTAAAVESRLAGLHVTGSLSLQIALLFADIEAIARRRRVVLKAFRHEGNARFAVAFDGDYPAALQALGDLANSRLAAHVSVASFERADGHVRAALTLDVLRAEAAREGTQLP